MVPRLPLLIVLFASGCTVSPAAPTDVGPILDRVANLEAQLTSLNGDLQEKSLRIEALEADLRVAEGDIALLQDQLTQLGTRTSASEAAVAQGHSDLEGVAQTLTDVELALSTLETDVAARNIDAHLVLQVVGAQGQPSPSVPPEQTFSLLSEALDALGQQRIAATASVTIQVDGIVEENGPVEVRHPDGDRIHIVGSGRAQAVIRSRVGAVIRVSQGRRLGYLGGLTLEPAVSATVQDGLVIEGAAYVRAGPLLVRNFEISCIRIQDQSALVFSGSYSDVEPSIEVSGCLIGLYATQGSYAYVPGARASSNSSVGLYALSGSTLIVRQAVGTQHTAPAGQVSHVVSADQGSFVDAYGAVLQGNLNSIGFDARHHSVMMAQDSRTVDHFRGYHSAYNSELWAERSAAFNASEHNYYATQDAYIWAKDAAATNSGGDDFIADSLSYIHAGATLLSPDTEYSPQPCSGCAPGVIGQ